jgi:hypothetical protein
VLREHGVGLQLSNKLKYALLTKRGSSPLRYIFLNHKTLKNMKILLIILSLMLCSSLNGQKYIDKLSTTDYTEWNGLDGPQSYEKGITALITYQGNGNFLFEIEVELSSGKSAVGQTAFKVQSIDNYDGVDAIHLKHEDNDDVYMFVRVSNLPHDPIYYFYDQQIKTYSPWRMKIKDKYIINMIDILVKPDNDQISKT